MRSARRFGHAKPVLTIGSLERFSDREYREQCAVRLVDILLDLENYRGVGRIFIP